MEHNITAIRPFIGARDFGLSRRFYRDLGFQEVILEPKLSLFTTGGTAFYLQDYYAREWIENTMIFLEVDDVERYWHELSAFELPNKYQAVKLTPIRDCDWGRECFLHDPSGILWHFGVFSKR